MKEFIIETSIKFSLKAGTSHLAGCTPIPKGQTLIFCMRNVLGCRISGESGVRRENSKNYHACP